MKKLFFKLLAKFGPKMSWLISYHVKVDGKSTIASIIVQNAPCFITLNDAARAASLSAAKLFGEEAAKHLNLISFSKFYDYAGK